MQTITADWLAGALGILLSLILGYFPPVRKRYEPLEPDVKQAINGGLIVVIGIGAFALSCFQLFNLQIACTRQGFEGVVEAIVVALVTNASTFQSTKYIGTARGALAKLRRAASQAVTNVR